MATVADLSGNFPASLPTGVDRSYAGVSRKSASTPQGSLTPAFVGEIVLTEDTGELYVAQGLTDTDWAVATQVV